MESYTEVGNLMDDFHEELLNPDFYGDQLHSIESRLEEATHELERTEMISSIKYVLYSEARGGCGIHIDIVCGISEERRKAKETIKRAFPNSVFKYQATRNPVEQEWDSSVESILRFSIWRPQI